MIDENFWVYKLAKWVGYHESLLRWILALVIIGVVLLIIF